MPACQKNPFAKELKLIFKNTPSRPGSPEGRQQASAKLYVNFIINFTKNKDLQKHIVFLFIRLFPRRDKQHHRTAQFFGHVRNVF